MACFWHFSNERKLGALNAKRKVDTVISSLNANVSGVKAFQQKFNVTSNNIANVNTDEFKKQRALLHEDDSGGIRVEVDKVDTPGYPKETVVGGKVIQSETSNVDLAEEMTETIPTQAGYDANLKAIQTEDEMMGTLLDVVG